MHRGGLLLFGLHFDVASHPSHVHLFALASANRTILFDSRFPNAPLLSRSHVSTTSSDAVTLFFRDDTHLMSASSAGVVAQHRVLFSGDCVQWHGEVLLTQTAMTECHTLLTGCCVDASAPLSFFVSSLHGDVCMHRIGEQWSDTAVFRRRALWRTLQPHPRDAVPPYQFATFGEVVTHLAHNIPVQPCVAQCAAAEDELFAPAPAKIDDKGMATVAALQGKWKME